jgi:hypothetical protein
MIHLLVHIHQKKKIAVDIAAKFANADGPQELMFPYIAGVCTTFEIRRNQKVSSPG